MPVAAPVAGVVTTFVTTGDAIISPSTLLLSSSAQHLVVGESRAAGSGIVVVHIASGVILRKRCRAG